MQLKITLIIISSLFLFESCSDKKDGCDKEIPDYFEINGLENYCTILQKIDLIDYKESYTKSNIFDSLDIRKFRIVGQFDVSNYGRYGDECESIRGDLGAIELTKKFKLIDIDTKEDITYKFIVSEAEIPFRLDFTDNFSVYYPGINNNKIYNKTLDSLDNIGYRMMLPNYLLMFKNNIKKGKYGIEIYYRFETIKYIDSVRFEII